MTYDYELTLIGATSYTADAVGNQIPVAQDIKILCGLKSISQNEFYSAALTDLKPEIKLVIHTFEYNNEKKVKFKGLIYKVLRAFQVNCEELELTCERIGADG